jgi:hypothetical protein
MLIGRGLGFGVGVMEGILRLRLLRRIQEFSPLAVSTIIHWVMDRG